MCLCVCVCVLMIENSGVIHSPKIHLIGKIIIKITLHLFLIYLLFL